MSLDELMLLVVMAMVLVMRVMLVRHLTDIVTVFICEDFRTILRRYDFLFLFREDRSVI